MLNEFIWPVRVYYEDTDSGGVVYHSNYLNFMERARTEWLRSMHLEQDDIVNEYGILFVVHSLSINYLKPALFNEALLVKTTIQKLTKASIAFEQLIVRKNDETDEEQILTKGVVKIVSLGVEQKRPVPLPEPIYTQFSH
ncbi:MAG: tol-pal system-associated acyl-CoA thioesterase [gamma proteobacterium symbiont of Lucinoma myriamae]|nr:tol-pal system-associated acyl-CoA thioesterase [gamma proteobacterium symbiont of Lucinoma myriamae]MCU7820057.1 tol-pal system-associated acyl-CoA thioesterase [gamma proteobacterium symbiont of Lucinoma myriamae]MCU7831475.1 tol-pal system-associated acyl-CoA thioesterase [gamma proteobacterium symbiont of Lucinoma myriamae]